MWNLVILEPHNKHCYLEGCYENFKDAHRRGKQICGENPLNRSCDYRVLSEMEYIQFKNPYIKE